MKWLYAIEAVLAVLFVVTQAACGSTTGWKLSFGVSPVSQIDETQKHGPRVIPVNDERRY